MPESIPNDNENKREYIEMITDPYEALEVLGTADSKGTELTAEQIEQLKSTIESDEEAVLYCYMQYHESGVVDDPTDIERDLIMWAEGVLLQTEAPEVATYLLKHARSLSPEDRKRLESIASV